LALYEAYLKAHPQDPTALFGLALCQNAVGNEAAARQALTETLRYQPDNVDALVLQGKLDVTDGHAEAAAAELQRAEKLAPWRVDILHNLASALQDLHQDRRAEEYRQREKRLANQVRQLDALKKELHAKPRDVALRYQIAELNRRMGDMKEAMLWYTGVLAIDPNHAPSRKALEDYLRQTTLPQSTSHPGRP
ncbi:MAG TPA: tetratricopeptide repeat protein, partial [Gemmataceae bacterium]|nr:tetratricopeptide repeat protein [Gemmataceae bacterium]